MTGIYKITNPAGKIYIGQSINIQRRFKSYFNLNCKKQIKLFNSLKKYGVENHIFETVCICTKEELNDKERHYQDLYLVISGNGLNCILTVLEEDKRKDFFVKKKQRMIDKIEKEKRNKITSIIDSIIF